MSDQDVIDNVENQKEQHVKERLDREHREMDDVSEEQKRNKTDHGPCYVSYGAWAYVVIIR